MNLLFIHRNMPCQFEPAMAALAATGAHRIVAISASPNFHMAGVSSLVYEVPQVQAAAHPFLASTEQAVQRGEIVAQVFERLKAGGFSPDLVIAHPGWGESLYVKEVFPAAPLLHYDEWYYRSRGADVNFHPDHQQTLAENCATRSMNAPLLLALEAADWGLSPTHWQKAQHPAAFQPRISVIFDGIDTARVAPAAGARFTLPSGRVLAPGDEVVTYVSRSLEPYRGFPTFIRALPEILRQRPQAQVVIVGGDGVSYGAAPWQGGSWRAALEVEVPLDLARVHFLGRIAYEEYLRLLQVSAAHVYLTMPFVLSWSMVEAMAAGCLVIGSATPPVEELITDGRNGFLVDFFSPGALSERVCEALRVGDKLQSLRTAARATVQAEYSVDNCLPQQLALIATLAAGKLP